MAFLMPLALPFLVGGCGGAGAPIPGEADMLGAGGGGDGGLLPIFSSCTDNTQCQSMLCTKISYDRSPTAICTFQCDAANMNPNCPMGCNLKGYCKKPM